MPRDRNGDFEPIIVKKKQNDTDISESLISKITDGVAEEVKAWQSRALEGVQLKVGAKNKRVFPSDESVFKTL